MFILCKIKQLNLTKYTICGWRNVFISIFQIKRINLFSVVQFSREIVSVSWKDVSTTAFWSEL